jgi:hypothetical protein
MLLNYLWSSVKAIITTISIRLHDDVRRVEEHLHIFSASAGDRVSN